LSAFSNILYEEAMPANATWQKLQTFNIQDGGRLPSSKSFFRHTSAIDRPISAIFLQYDAQ